MISEIDKLINKGILPKNKLDKHNIFIVFDSFSKEIIDNRKQTHGEMVIDSLNKAINILSNKNNNYILKLETGNLSKYNAFFINTLSNKFPIEKIALTIKKQFPNSNIGVNMSFAPSLKNKLKKYNNLFPIFDFLHQSLIYSSYDVLFKILNNINKENIYASLAIGNFFDKDLEEEFSTLNYMNKNLEKISKLNPLFFKVVGSIDLEETFFYKIKKYSSIKKDISEPKMIYQDLLLELKETPYIIYKNTETSIIQN